MSTAETRGGMIASRFGVAALVIFALLPVYAALITSLTPAQFVGDGSLYPRHLTFENYVEIWSRMPLLKYLGNTLLYATAAGVLGAALASSAAYAISRMRFHGKGFLLAFILVTQVVPLIVIALPLFTLVRNLGLFDSRFAVIIVFTAVALPYPIFLLKSYFDQLPVELEEAAMVDGCGRFRTFALIVVPVALPAVVTSFGLTFFQAWQQFLLPLVLTQSDDLVPVTVGVYRLQGAQHVPWELLTAGTLIAIVPPVVMYGLVQRFLLEGMASGSVKG